MSARCVVVMGGDSGIGAACSVAFGEVGDDVVIAYHSDEEGARGVADRVIAAGGRAKAVRADIADEHSVDVLFHTAAETFGEPAVLVNSAGGNMAGVEVRDMTLDHWQRLIAAEEAARSVRVNAVEPGMILTPMNQGALDNPDRRRAMEANFPMRRAGRPEAVAAMVRWLASDEAGYVTGATFRIDGGLSPMQALGA